MDLCKLCNKTFSKKSNLKRHTKNVHSTSTRESFICYHCSQNFRQKSNLVKHIAICESHKRRKNTTKIISCCLCNEAEIPKHDILQHYNLIHGLDMTIRKLSFDSYVEFEQWKDKLESDTVSKYTRFDISRSQTNVVYYYHCHRDGFFTSRGQNIKQLKLLGSNKINGHCPAKIRASVSQETGKISVDFLPTHVGHSNTDLRKIPLKKPQRELLAAKIQQKIPFDEILNQIRDSADEKHFERLHLLTRKDLFNIEREFNIDNSVRHTNDTISLEAWINQSNEKNAASVVRFYKKQGELKEDCDYNFDENDFLLIIMNDAQLELLKKYGNDCICIDRTHELKLTTVMVLDDLRQGFPCMFAFSNRSDTHIFKVIFDILKTHLEGETLKPNVFMSDMANTFYNAWSEIMGPVKMRLYCSWLVNRAWKKNVLAKVKNPERQKTLFKILRTLLEEPDKIAFEKMLQASLIEFEANADWKSFATYFRENYLENRTAWAYCYRQHAGIINTNMHIERMHHTLKYIYLKGKSVRRIDKTINGIMQMVRDKLYEHPIILHKGKISKKLCDLRQRHITSKQIPMDYSLIVTNEDGTWTIPSSQANEFYKIEVFNPGCTCALRCQDCDACLHSYICTCVDSGVKWNMCKHIHMICMYLKNNRSIDVDVNMDHRADQVMKVEDDDLDNNLLIDENPKTADQNQILNHLSQPTHLTSEVDKRKAKIVELFHSHLNSATTIEHCKVIENALLPIGPTLTFDC